MTQDPPEPPPYAPAPYQQVNDEQRQILRTRGIRALIFGAVWFVGGLILSAVTYSAAASGGVYIVAWGPMLYGIIQIVIGLVRLNKAKTA
jgi:hypothetical protein